MEGASSVLRFYGLMIYGYVVLIGTQYAVLLDVTRLVLEVVPCR